MSNKVRKKPTKCCKQKKVMNRIMPTMLEHWYVPAAMPAVSGPAHVHACIKKQNGRAPLKIEHIKVDADSQ